MESNQGVTARKEVRPRPDGEEHAVKNFVIDPFFGGKGFFQARLNNKVTPVKIFNSAEIKSLMKKHGFEVFGMHYYNYNTGVLERYSWQGQIFCVARKL